MSIRRLAIVANETKAGVVQLAGELVSLAKSRGVEAEVLSGYPLPDTALKGFDACAVLGGDGTLLGVVSQAVLYQVPLFGINRGKLGFLANYPSENALESLSDVLRGEYQQVKRTLLECRTTGGCYALALNDIVIKTVDQARMATLKVSSHGRFINSYRCDGLILATPTGSTAYNLAAGGPLIYPDSSVFAITPICPHTLSNRTVIVPGDSIIEVDNEEKNAALNISVDGVPFQSTCTSFPITASISEKKLPLIQPKGLSHFELLRTKLNWE